MTRRHAEKGASERPAAREQRVKSAGTRAGPGKIDGLGTEKSLARPTEAQLLARLAVLETERDVLAAELGALQQRCRHLEDVTTQVRNRLGWAIDSVESVLQGKG